MCGTTSILVDQRHITADAVGDRVDDLDRVSRVTVIAYFTRCGVTLTTTYGPGDQHDDDDNTEQAKPGGDLDPEHG